MKLYATKNEAETAMISGNDNQNDGIPRRAYQHVWIEYIRYNGRDNFAGSRCTVDGRGYNRLPLPADTFVSPDIAIEGWTWNHQG